MESLIQESETRYSDILVTFGFQDLLFRPRVQSFFSCWGSLESVFTVHLPVANIGLRSVSLVQGFAQKHQDPSQLTASDCLLCSRQALSHCFLFLLTQLGKAGNAFKKRKSVLFLLESCIPRMPFRLYFLGKKIRNLLPLVLALILENAGSEATCS